MPTPPSCNEDKDVKSNSSHINALRIFLIAESSKCKILRNMNDFVGNSKLLELDFKLLG